MGSRCDRKRVSVVGDRLSSLPDDLIHKILYFIDLRQAIKTSSLSSRWRYIWTSMPCLNFSNKDYHTFTKFSKFVTCVMSNRNNQIEVSSVRLTFHGTLSQPFVERILNIIYTSESSHNVQQLNITYSPEKDIEFPRSLFSFQSLKHLSLNGCTYKHPILTTPTWELINLTTLNLYRVEFCVYNTTEKCASLFSNFANLKNLTLIQCTMTGLNGFNICHPRLSNLTLEDGHEGGNVVTPQLKNLTIRCWRKTVMISAPNLASLHYKDSGHYPLHLSVDLLHLEKVDICISHPSFDKAHAHKIVCLLQQLSTVKFLALNLEIIKCLSSSLELISRQPSPFANLKSLKIYPLGEQTWPKVTMCAEVENYLLESSPSATFTMVSHEEIQAVKNVTLARNLMGKLHVILDKWKETSETNTADMKQDKAPMESHVATVPDQVEIENQLDMDVKWEFWGRVQHINEQFKKGYRNTDRIASKLWEIRVVLDKLPTSHRAKLQVSFSRLCAKAEASMDAIVDDLKIQCDKKPRLYFH